MKEENALFVMLVSRVSTRCTIPQNSPRKSLMKIPQSVTCKHDTRSMSPLVNIVSALFVIVFLPVNVRVATGEVFQSIKPGDRLLANNSDVLVSRNEYFSLGFFNDNQNQVYFGIWFTGGGADYQKISKVVWVANRNTPGLSTLYADFRRDGVLYLSQIGSNSGSIWQQPGNASAVMGDLLDSGNFVLRNASNTSVWESFDEPTDTLLPGQIFRQGSQLSSWGNGGNSPVQGMYSLNWQIDSSIVLYASNQVSYWNSETQSTNVGVSVAYALLDNGGDFAICNVTGPHGLYNKTFTSSSLGELGLLRRLTLDSDGNLRMYIIDSTLSWIVTWAAVSSSKCIPNVTLNTASNCNQEGNLLPADPSPAAGPTPPSSASAPPATNKVVLVIVVACVTIFGVVAIIASLVLCWCLKRNGSFLSAKSSTSIQAVDSRRSTDSLNSVKSHSSTGFVRVDVSNSLHETGVPPQKFSFEEIQQATRNFRTKLGSGGFGDVYKGKLPDNRLIAVKRLARSQQGDQQFQTEVLTVGSIFHPNLVRLYGFCTEDQYQMLVYEFVANRSLERFIFSDATAERNVLDWPTRLSIALGTARGLQQCHELEGGRPRVIHCDVKPENILLDSKFCVKVADFGLAKIMGIDKSWTRTHLRGTRGYLAPEWLSGHIVSVKVDVYSYGIVLLEIISGSRCCDQTRSDFDYLIWVYNEVVLGMVANVVDKSLKSYDEKQVLLALRCALWCAQEKEHMRPSMGMVVQMLEGKEPVLTPPPPKAVPEDETEVCSSTSGHDRSIRER